MTEATIQTHTILDRLVASKREQLASRRAVAPLAQQRALAEAAPAPLRFAAALRGENVRVIAEIKKASPAKGLLEPDFDPVTRARSYRAGGAAAVSVLTEERRFLGSLDDLIAVRRALADAPLPLLRKDFLFDPYQLYEARAAGADAVLLIVAVLTQPALVDLLALARRLGLDALVEVHDEDQVERALVAGATLIGINNRDLRSFHTDLAVSERLGPLIPEGCTLVSESGISARGHVDRLAALGFDAILVGEALMRSGDIGTSLRELAGSSRRCGGVR